MEFKDKLLEQLNREDLADNEAKVSAIIEAVGEFIPKGTYNNLSQRLKNVEVEKDRAISELDSFKKSQLTAEEAQTKKFEEIIKRAEERERNAAIRENGVEAKSILIEAGLSKEQIESDDSGILNSIVTENREETLSKANSIALLFKNQKEKVEKEIKNKYYNDNPQPPAGEPNKDVVTKEQLDKMTYSEEMEFAAKNPALYAELLNKK